MTDSSDTTNVRRPPLGARLETWLRSRQRKGVTQTVQTERDQALLSRVASVFESDLERASVSGLKLYVQNAVVTVYGTVDHALDEQLIVRVVQTVPGVQAVIPHLQTVRARERTIR
jgi:osmotically-inducible protein OsmY